MPCLFMCISLPPLPTLSGLAGLHCCCCCCHPLCLTRRPLTLNNREKYSTARLCRLPLPLRLPVRQTQTVGQLYWPVSHRSVCLWSKVGPNSCVCACNEFPRASHPSLNWTPTTRLHPANNHKREPHAQNKNSKELAERGEVHKIPSS